MQLKVVDLIDALAKLKPGLAKNELIEHTTFFVFDTDRIYTYNDRIAITTPYKSGIKGAVKGMELYNLLGKLDTETIRIRKSENELQIICKDVKAGLKMVPTDSIKWSEFPRIKKPQWLPLPKDFLEAVRFSIFSCAKDATYGLLTYLQVKKDYVNSCDNYRATRYQLASKVKDPFLLHGPSALELVNYNPVKYMVFEGWVHFLLKDGSQFSTRTGPHKEYKDITSLFDVEGATIKLPPGFTDVVDRCQVLTKDQFEAEQFVEMKIEKGKVTCKGIGANGWVEETKPLKYKGKTITMRVHPTFLLEILTYSRKFVVSDTKALFQTDNFSHVMALVGDE